MYLQPQIVGQCSACYNSLCRAGVTELAVMRDSKSRAVTPRKGSTPFSGTTRQLLNIARAGLGV